MAGGRAAARPAGARSASGAPRRLLALLALQCCGALRVPAPPARRAADPQLVLAPVPARDGSVELARAAALYRRVSEGDSYAALAGLQAGVLACGSDAASQMMHGLPVDLAHVYAMGTLGCFLSGAFNAAWLRQLEARFPGRRPPAIAAKTATDYACAMGINSMFLVLVPLLTAVFASGCAPEAGALLDGWTPEGFRAAMLLEARRPTHRVARSLARSLTPPAPARAPARRPPARPPDPLPYSSSAPAGLHVHAVQPVRVPAHPTEPEAAHLGGAERGVDDRHLGHHPRLRLGSGAGGSRADPAGATRRCTLPV